MHGLLILNSKTVQLSISALFSQCLHVLNLCLILFIQPKLHEPLVTCLIALVWADLEGEQGFGPPSPGKSQSIAMGKA